jgi:hypothetical protein
VTFSLVGPVQVDEKPRWLLQMGNFPQADWLWPLGNLPFSSSQWGSMNTALIWLLVAILLGVLGLVGLNHRLAGTRAVIECYIPDVSRPPA